MKRFFSFVRRYGLSYTWWYVGGFLAIGFTQYLIVRIIGQVKIAIDALTEADRPLVLTSLWLLLGFTLTAVVIRILSRLLIFTPGRLVEYKVRNDYYQTLLFLSRSFYQKHAIGDLVSRCSNDIAFVRAAFGFAVLQLGNVFITIFFGIQAMWNMNADMTKIIAIPMVVSFAIIQVSLIMMQRFWRVANIQVGDLSSLCFASYKGVSSIQGYHAEPRFIGLFSDLNNQYLATNRIIVGTRSFIMPIVQLVGNLCIFLILWNVAPQVITSAMTIGELTAFLGYIGMVMPPLLLLGWMFNVFHRAIPAMERLDEVLQMESEDKPLEHPEIPENWQLSVKQLTHRFPKEEDKDFLIDDISFDLVAGKSLGIVGPIGSGKTALIDCLVRLNEIGPGMVSWNQRDACDFALPDYRQAFAYAPQNPFLFSTSLRENLHIADQGASDETLEAGLAKAGFDLDPKQFPKGLETEVGEKGVMLSGGQKQRIALARAFLRPAPVLILDDVLSAVDHATEYRIVQNLKSDETKRAMIIVSHRLSAVRECDEILVLDEGRIVDRGNHTFLMDHNAYYREMVQAQSEKETP